MIEKCMACGQRLDVTHMGPPQHYAVAPPFQAKIDALTITCRACQQNHVVVNNAARPSSFVAYRLERECLVEGRDYVWAETRKPRPPLDGTRPLYIAWMWTPMPDDPLLAERLVDAARNDDDFHRKDRMALALMEFDNIIPKAVTALRYFDGCLLLKRHVMAGANGPYPSLRAERSIARTFAPCNLRDPPLLAGYQSEPRRLRGAGR